MLDSYKKKSGKWEDYAKQFLTLLAEREIETRLPRSSFEGPAVLLCSEPTAEHCHRRLVIEYLQSKWADIVSTNL
jgi:uncharacterized protein (DUF488 family)